MPQILSHVYRVLYAHKGNHFNCHGTEMINYFTEDIEFAIKDKRFINKWLRQVAANSQRVIGDLNYIFASDSYILDINKQYLGHDYYTDIITFDNSIDYSLINGRNKICGDIYISIDTVRANGLEYGEGFDRELHRVIVHGLLHLLGYDDTNEVLLALMRQQENIALSLWSDLLLEKR